MPVLYGYGYYSKWVHSRIGGGYIIYLLLACLLFTGKPTCPDVNPSLSLRNVPEHRVEVLQDARITYYHTGTTTASGTKVTEGRTVAGPKWIPFGTKVVIDGHVYTVEDRYANWVQEKHGNTFDIYVAEEVMQLYRKDVLIIWEVE